MKYKVGDKVRIKTNLPKYESNQCGVTDAMVGMEGQVHIIEEISHTNHNYKIFTNSGDDYWWFSEEMLELVEEQPVLSKGLVRIHDIDTHELWTTPFIILKDRLDALVDAWAKLGCTTFNLLSDEVKETIKETEEKKMSTKFAFYVKEGTRIDKSCNKTVPTMTTFVSIGRYHSGKATCDKADYDERQGCLEAIANAFLDGNFDRDFNRAVKANELADKKKRTCVYCGKVFDTIEECEAEEAWHVERKKARRERYLLRKRAKEIAFEEQAQKLAKEIIAEDNKKIFC